MKRMVMAVSIGMAVLSCHTAQAQWDLVFRKLSGWPTSFFLTDKTNSLEVCTRFIAGHPIYYTAAFWDQRHNYAIAQDITNTIYVVGEGVERSWHFYKEDGLDIYWYGYTCSRMNTNLQNLPPGEYTATIVLNEPRCILETDYANNSNSVKFVVVPSTKVTFRVDDSGSAFTIQYYETGGTFKTLPSPPSYSGYEFHGWYTSVEGGHIVTEETRVPDSPTILYANWVGNPYKVRFNANGGMGTMPDQSFRYGTEQKLSANVFTRKMYAFCGWALSADGDVAFADEQSVANLVSAGNGVVTLYAVWKWVRPVLWTDVTGAAPMLASTYDGYLYDANGNVRGTVQVKVGKPNRKADRAAVRATVVGLDGKKKTLKAVEKGKAQIAVDGPTTVSLTGGDACEVLLGAKGMAGTYGNYAIDGSLNVFASKDAADKDVASAALGKWQGAVNVAWQGLQGWNGLSVTIAAKGKAKVSGTFVDGTKVSAKGQLAVGEDWCCVPVVYAKKGVSLAFNMWLPKTATSATLPIVFGLGDAIVGRPGTLKAGATFKLGAVIGNAKYEAYLPNGVAVGGGAKWTLPKDGKVQVSKDGTVDETKLGENPSALKLTYKAKDGTFKGSFKVYADVNGKPKATTVKVVGVLVNGTGYGAAMIKGREGATVRIE